MLGAQSWVQGHLSSDVAAVAAVSHFCFLHVLEIELFHTEILSALLLLTLIKACWLLLLLFLSFKERELEANKKEKVKEAQLEAEVKLLRKENEALRRHIAVLQAEVYGARLAAKYLDKELAGRHVIPIHVLSMSFSCCCYKTFV